jgi:GNAT superfamily N-acetyltransferase
MDFCQAILSSPNGDPQANHQLIRSRSGAMILLCFFIQTGYLLAIVFGSEIELRNAVYTPPELRRQGFATAYVARLSKELLDEGFAFCVLFTDLANPTSNSIYARIGYQAVGDFTLYRFEAEPTTPITI